MRHLAPANKCPLCMEKLKGCHPSLALIIQQLLDNFPDCHIAWGYRNKEMQELFFNEGKSRAHFPNSAHNKTRGGKACSLAVDLFQIDAQGLAQFRGDYYRKLSQWLKSVGAMIKWGGENIQLRPGVWDGPHFQLDDSLVGIIDQTPLPLVKGD